MQCKNYVAGLLLLVGICLITIGALIVEGVLHCKPSYNTTQLERQPEIERKEETQSKVEREDNNTFATSERFPEEDDCNNVFLGDILIGMGSVILFFAIIAICILQNSEESYLLTIE